MVVVITGGTGLIGKAVASLLMAKGHEVRILSRSRGTFRWDPEQGTFDMAALEGAHAVVHLAGENIAGRWTEAKKSAIVESRRKAAALLAESLRRAGVRPVICAASAIGFYGDRGSETLTEESAAGNGFLAETTALWEQSLRQLESLAERFVMLRVGVVLDRAQGALPKMALPVKFLAGAPLGSGEQYVSWIHIADMARLIAFSLDRNFEMPGLARDMQGTYNAAAGAVTNRAMTDAIGRALHRPVFLPAVPGFILKTLLGEMSTLVLESARVSAEKARTAGFRFRFADLDQALSDIYS